MDLISRKYYAFNLIQFAEHTNLIMIYYLLHYTHNSMWVGWWWCGCGLVGSRVGMFPVVLVVDCLVVCLWCGCGCS